MHKNDVYSIINVSKWHQNIYKSFKKHIFELNMKNLQNNVLSYVKICMLFGRIVSEFACE